MAQSNSFLRSPFDDIASQSTQDDSGLLPGQQPVKATPQVEMQPTPARAAPQNETPSTSPAPAAADQPAPSPRRHAENWLPPADQMPIFEAAAQHFNVPVNVLMALGKQESSYRSDAIGVPTEWGRAKGIMQYLDSTAKGLGINPFDPAEAIPAAAKQIRERLDAGASMKDAVMEHFAGPDRAKWGPKTAAYGDEVMGKVDRIGQLYTGGAAPAGGQPQADKPDLTALQQQLDTEEPGRYKVLPEGYAESHFSAASMPRDTYEQTFRSVNPSASDAAIANAMQQYDQQAQARAAQPKVGKADARFAALNASPEAQFDAKLNEKLQGQPNGIVPPLPAKIQPEQVPAFDAASADKESALGAAASYLGKSFKAGMYDLAGAGAKVLDEINPWTLSPSDAAVLFKNDPEKLKQFQDDSAAMILSRFAKRMTKNSDESMQEISDRAKRDYGSLEYATTDTGKAAYLSPTKVIGDAIRSLPTSAAMAVSVYLTRGAAARAEQTALAAGMTEEAARQAAIAAGAKAMATTGAASEGVTGYAQQANQSAADAAKVPMAEMAKSPKFQKLVNEDGFTPEAARAKIIADTGEEAGRMAGIVDAAVNHVGGEFLGKILTEGGKLIPRIMKGAANESATEFVQSAGEQLGQNKATRDNINQNQSLTEGVGEAAVAGAAVGGVMGGGMAGAGGKGHTAETPAVAPPAAQPQPAPVVAAGTAPVAQASAAPGPLSRSLENAAEQHAGQENRVTATAPSGEQVSGQIAGYHEDADGNFVAQIVADDGTVVTLDSRTGVQIEADATPDAGPLTSALSSAADQHAAAPPVATAAPVEQAAAPVAAAPAAEAPAPAPAPAPVPKATLTIQEMTDQQLQDRLKYIASQAKESGWDKRFVEARRAVEIEIKKRATAAPTTEASDVTPANDGRGSNSIPARNGPDNVGRPGADRPLPVDGRADAGLDGKQVAADLPAASGAADTKPALINPYQAYSAASAERAQAYMVKRGADPAKFEVKQTGPVRWQVVPKEGAAATPAPDLKAFSGRNLGKGWTAFKPSTGTVGVPRAKMPQVKSEHRGAMVNFLNARGVAHEQVEVPAGDLKPTQREFSAEKVAQSRDNAGGDRSILISSDNYVVDGHHQWLAQMGSNEPVKAIRLNAPIADLLPLVHEFPSSMTAAEQVKESAPAAEKVPEVAPKQAKPKQEPRRKGKAKAEPEEDGARFSVAPETAGATDTPAFKRWFGDSKVADADGKPLVVYHGTNKDIAKFKGGQIWLTSDPELANKFVAGGRRKMGDKAGRGSAVYPLYASIKNPVDLRGLGLADIVTVPEILKRAGIESNDAMLEKMARDNLESGYTGVGQHITDPVAYVAEGYRSGSRLSNLLDNPALKAALEADGVDGYRLTEQYSKGTRKAPEIVDAETFAAFNPEQVKSVTGNSGEFDAAKADIRYSIAGDGKAQAEFGPVHTEYRDDAAGAIKQLMADKDGEAIVHRDDVGDISLVYGDGKMGLSHIARRRGAEFMDRLPGLLADGTLYSKPGQKDRVFIGTDRDEAVLRFEWDGKAKTWLLSAYEKYPDLKPTGADVQASRRSQVVDERTAAPLDKAALRQAVTRGVLGQVVNSMIDAGIVVLHDSPSTLPRNVGYGVKGIQAVTTPDGKVHLVAANLSADNANAVMLHEAFHQGAEKLLGTEQWGALMGRMGSLYRQGEQSSGKAKEFFDKARARVAAAKAKGGVATKMEVEEFAAYAIEEYESAPATVKKWVGDLLGMIKAWLVKRFGKQFGDVTPAQLAAFAKWAVMDHAVERRGDIFGDIGNLFSMAGSITDTPAFKRWFGKSKVVDENGAPLVVYHGTTDDFSAFDPSKLGDSTKHVTAKMGFFFSADPEVTTIFNTEIDETKYPFRLVSKKGASTVPVYLTIKNPKEMTVAEFRELEPWTRDELREAGYDGVRIIADPKLRDTYGGDEWRADTWVALDPEQIKSAIGNNGEFDPANSDIRYSLADDTRTTTAPAAPQEPNRYTPAEQGLARRTQAAVQDNLNRVTEVQNKIKEVTGRTTLGKADYRAAEVNRPGRIAARLEDAQDKLTGPLMEELAKSGRTPEQLSELLHAQHAQERNEAVARINDAMPDGGSGMTTADANKIIDRYKDDAPLQALAKKARAIAKATLDLKLAYGLIKPQDHEMLSTMYENYVPLKGDGEYGPKVKRAMGHEEREEHILENIARDYDQAVVTGEKNLARQSLLQMVLKFPDAELWTAGIPPRGRYVAGKVYSVQDSNGKEVGRFTSQSQVTAFLEGKGPAASRYSVYDSAGERVTEFTKPLQDNEVMVYVNGDPVRLQIHDEKLAAQLRPLNQDQMGPILSSFRKMNRYLSSIYTGYNPAFILRNASRDAITGTINMLGNEGAAVAAKAWAKYPAAVAALGQWAATKKAPDSKTGRYLTEYRMHGGKTGASYMSDLEQQGEKLQFMYDKTRGLLATAADGGMTKEGIKRTSAVAWNKTIGRLAHVIEIANQATENGLRLGLYIALREEGVSADRAAQAAKGVTVDFDRKGASTGALGAIYLFFNPAVQGTANAMKTLMHGQHKAQAWSALGGLVAAGFLAASKGMDDDKDKWLGEGWDTRTKNLIVNTPGHQLRAPMSQEFAPAYAFGVAVAEASRGESKTRTAARIISSFIDAYFPLQGAYKEESDNHLADVAQAATPTVIKPLIESAMNRNSFGSQVVPESDLTKDKPDNLKMNRGTKNTAYDKAAQGIAAAGESIFGVGKYENDITKVSPETLKSLWRTYTGGLGQFITDSAGVATMAGKDMSQVEASDVPIIKDFYRPSTVGPIRSRYYDLSKEAKAAITEFEQAKKLGDGDELSKIADGEKGQLIGLGRMVRATSKAAAALGDEKVEVVANKDLTDAEKRTELKRIEKEEEELYRSGIEAFK